MSDDVGCVLGYGNVVGEVNEISLSVKRKLLQPLGRQETRNNQEIYIVREILKVWVGPSRFSRYQLGKVSNRSALARCDQQNHTTSLRVDEMIP